MRNHDYLHSRQHRQAHIRQAIDTIGGTAKAADKLGVDKSTVTQWMKRAMVPREQCKPLAKLSRRTFRPQCVRPLWPVEKDMADVLDAAR